jgi:hypothetical protein
MKHPQATVFIVAATGRSGGLERWSRSHRGAFVRSEPDETTLSLPQVAGYTGSGSTDAAESFTCR